MREITVQLYKFDELTEQAKEKAREWARDDEGMRSQWAWDQIQEDARAIGLDIHELDLHSANRGEFYSSALDCAKLIKKNHGNTCETFKTAAKYYENLNSDDEMERENSEHEFLHDLLEDYRIMFDKEVEYAYSQEAIDEDMRANEYEFTGDGKIA